ncbi:MAG: XisI protein [Acidobacteria bacterium]|nr:XisI protein [Acidobacteriota bacterium]
MDQTMNYADILSRVIHEEGKLQPSFQPRLKIVSVCDQETRQFLLIAVGWEGRRRADNILFHAQLADGKVSIETDMTEEGLKQTLIEAGIREEDFLSDKERDRLEAERVAA